MLERYLFVFGDDPMAVAKYFHRVTSLFEVCLWVLRNSENWVHTLAVT